MRHCYESRRPSHLPIKIIPTERFSSLFPTTSILPCRHLITMTKRDESRNLTPSAERGKETIIPPSFRLSIKVSMRMLRGNCTTTASTIMIRIQELISARLQ